MTDGACGYSTGSRNEDALRDYLEGGYKDDENVRQWCVLAVDYSSRDSLVRCFSPRFESFRAAAVLLLVIVRLIFGRMWGYRWHPLNPMAPWWSWVFLLHPLRIVYSFLPFQVHLPPNRPVS